MGRAVQERERTVLRDERRAFLEIRELFDRQSLEFRLVGVRAEKAQARFAAREPVDTLAEVAEERHVHLAEQLLDESRADRRGFSILERSTRSGLNKCIKDHFR